MASVSVTVFSKTAAHREPLAVCKPAHTESGLFASIMGPFGYMAMTFTTAWYPNVEASGKGGEGLGGGGEGVV